MTLDDDRRAGTAAAPAPIQETPLHEAAIGAVPDLGRRRSLAVNTSVAASSSILRGLLAFAASLVVTRSLAPGPRGIVSFITTATALLVMVAGAGMPSALTRAKAKDGMDVPDLYRSSLLIGVVSGAVASVLFGVAFFAGREDLFAGVTGGEALVVALLVPPLLVLTHWNVVAYLEDRILEYTLAALAGLFLYLIGVSLLATARGLDAPRTIAIWAVTSFVPFAIVLRPSRVRGFWRRRRAARPLVRFALRANVASIALILAWRLDVFFVKGYRGATELGYYAVAVTLAEVLLQVAVSFRVALTPRQGAAHDRDDLVSSICLVTRLSVGLGAVAALTTAVLASPLVRLLYGDRYAPAAAAVAWLVAGVVALITQGPLIDFLLTEGRVRGVSIATGTALLLNIALDVWLLTTHSFVAAAAAATVAYMVSCTACIWLFRRTTPATLPDLVVLRASDVRRVLARLRTLRSA